MAMLEVMTVAALLTVTGTSTLTTEGAVIVRLAARGTATLANVVVSSAWIAAISVRKAVGDCCTSRAALNVSPSALGTTSLVTNVIVTPVRRAVTAEDSSVTPAFGVTVVVLPVVVDVVRL